MRKIGRLYLEEISDIRNACDIRFQLGEELKDILDHCSRKLETWRRTFDALSNRVEIDIDEPDRPTGDDPYFILLKNTEFAAYMFLSSDLAVLYDVAHKSEIPSADKRDRDARQSIYSICTTEADEFSHSGMYRRTACQQAIDKLGEEQRQAYAIRPAAQIPKAEFTGEEAKARSWHTKQYCEKDGYKWGEDKICHAK